MYANDLRRSLVPFVVLLLVGGAGSGCGESGSGDVSDAAMLWDGPRGSGEPATGGASGKDGVAGESNPTDARAAGADGLASGGASGAVDAGPSTTGGKGSAGETVVGGVGSGGTAATGGMGAVADASASDAAGLASGQIDTARAGIDAADSCVARPLRNWSAMSVAGAPNGFPVRDLSYDRIDRVFWTGTDLAVFSPTGGVGRYDPCTDTWRRVVVPVEIALGAAVARNQSGIYFLYVNGSSTQFVFHDLTASTWRKLSIDGIPTVGIPAINLVGDKLVIWGAGTWGNPSNAGVVYNPVTDQWKTMSTKDAPAARVLGATAIPRMGNVVTAGDKLFVWGGAPDPSVTDATSLPGIECPADTQDCQFSDGALYDPVADRWTPVATKGAPTGRMNHQTFWTGSRIVVWGGARYDINPATGSLTYVYLSDGGVYDPAGNTWAPLPAPVGNLASGIYLLMVNGRLVALSPGAIYDETANQWNPAAHGQAVDWNECLAPLAFGDRVVVNCKSQIAVVDPLHSDVPTLVIPVPTDAPLGAYAVWSGKQVLRWGGYRNLPLPECPGGGSHCSDNPGSITEESNDGSVWSP